MISCNSTLYFGTICTDLGRRFDLWKRGGGAAGENLIISCNLENQAILGSSNLQKDFLPKSVSTFHLEHKMRFFRPKAIKWWQNLLGRIYYQLKFSALKTQQSIVVSHFLKGL